VVVFLVRNQLNKAKRIIIKLGTSTILKENGIFNYELINGFIKEIIKLKAQGKEIVIVSSGAVGLGNNHLTWQKSEDKLLNKCSASIGQSKLMYSYQNSFDKFNLSIAQLLLTNKNFKTNRRKKRIKNVLEKLLEIGIIPIINENDSITESETSFGDNDILAGHISNITKANLLIILSNVDGIYRNYIKKDVINYISKTDSTIKNYVTSNRSSFGKGGMMSKIHAAKICSQTNTMTVIANGQEKNILLKIINGKNIGTLINLEDSSK
jgi:glutamate 5-kinase